MDTTHIPKDSQDTWIPKDECGIVGIFATSDQRMDLPHMLVHSMTALQHRGQEGCGMACMTPHTDTGAISLYKAPGLVNQVFNDQILSTLHGTVGIGHTRYSTAGAKTNQYNVQPVVAETTHGAFAIAQNGHLTDFTSARRELMASGIAMLKDSDVEVIIQLIAKYTAACDGALPQGVLTFMERHHGAYSLVFLSGGCLYACRDKLGIRPLCLGVLPDAGGYIVASESCAFGPVGALYLRDIAPGELLRIEHTHDAVGYATVAVLEHPRRAMCCFEYIYLSRPDTIHDGQTVYNTRVAMGRRLALSTGVDADLVSGVPDSSIHAAIGYAQAAGMPYVDVLVKNWYIYRTFIQPTQSSRQRNIELKFNPLRDNVAGRRIVLVDDSIVRGNTMARIVQLLRRVGAAEVHVRIASPPIRYPCFMGVDMSTKDQLIAHEKSVDQICREIGADTLAFLEHDLMIQALGGADPGVSPADRGFSPADPGFCSACFTGVYPPDLDW